MTGQVKEDILSRWMELGVRVDGGKLGFDPAFFDLNEFLNEDVAWKLHGQTGHGVDLAVLKGQFAFSVCQVPVVYQSGKESLLTIHFAASEPLTRKELSLSVDESSAVFQRNGRITRIVVQFDSANHR